MARGTKFFPLKTVKDLPQTVKLRQSWSKYNLYNFSRIAPNAFRNKNFFQVKWKSKSLSRNYHGYQVREKVWQRMFDRRVRSVIPMNPEYLASNDGTNESAGRGSGLAQEGRALKKLPIPYMQMTYAPLERRLDTAIFRAMFASSIRQARQFVIHGSVKVNGKRMQYPGYLLNPGDMFQVVPDRVMYAAGQPKINIAVRKAQAQLAAENEEAEAEQQAEQEQPVIEAEPEEDLEDDRDPREVLRELQAQAKNILASPRENIGAKRKQDLRAFTKSIRKLLSRGKSDTIHTASIEAQFAEIQNQLKIRRELKSAATESSSPSQDKSTDTDTTKDSQPQQSTQATTGNILTDTEFSQLFAALQSMQENPVDESKPYATPWMPRDYMSAFAFIPRYLEVNHNICAAVYIRHPVARPGLAEVPTPFNEFINSSAYAWYLRRR